MTRHERQWGYSALRRSLGIVMLCVATVAGAQPATTPASATGTASLLDQTFDFDVPAQQVSTAILDIARQASVQALMAGNVLDEYQAEALNGNLTLAAALERVLADTPYAYLQTGRNAIMVGTPEALAAVPDDPKSPAVPADSNTGTAAEPEASIADIDSARRAGVEEIIVTGQKKAERLQDVPIAISAFSMETLDAQKIEGGFDLLKAVPNVTFSKTNFSGYNFQIRGIGTQAVSATTDPGVAVAFNNTTLIVNRLFEQEYLDIERVEVLRGPQGTLYGRNATAGVINVISAKPEMGVLGGEVKGEIGNYAARRLRGHVNVPLVGDTLALRAAYASTLRDGYGENLAVHLPDANVREDVDGRDLWTGRLTLGWQPTDMLNVNLMWERFEEDDNRVRTSKQLCHRDGGPEEVFGMSFPDVDASTEVFYGGLSQGCKAGSLYAPEAFGTPNGNSLPYISGPFFAVLYGGQFGAGGPPGGDPERSVQANRGLGPSPYQGTVGTPEEQARAAECSRLATGGAVGFGISYLLNPCDADPYRGQVQSTDLRQIVSLIEPQYRAEADVFDLSLDLNLTDTLVFSSQTLYARDEYYATQDYNRFTTFPVFEDTSRVCGIKQEEIVIPGIGGIGIFQDVIDCSDDPDTGRGTWMALKDANEDGFDDHTGRPLGVREGYTVDGDGYLRDVDGRRISFYDIAPGGVYCDPQLGCSSSLIVQDLSQSRSRQFNQEFRLVSSFDGPVNFSLGANYTNFETVNDYYVFSNVFSALLNLWPFNHHGMQCDYSDGLPSRFCRYVDPNPLNSINGEGHNYFRSANPYELTSTAIFGELYTQVTDTLKLTVGARFTWDEKVFTPIPSQLLLADYRNLTGREGAPPPSGEACTQENCPFAGNALGGRGSPALPPIVQEWREPTGRIVLDWSPDLGLSWLDESLFYASVARGYKGGGANPPGVAPPAGNVLARGSGGAAAPAVFKPEYVNAFEVGSKNTLFGGGLVLNANAFYYDYTDYQISKIVDRSAANENFDATVWGLELESFISPTPDLLLNMTVGYLRTRVADGEQSIDLMDRTDGGNRHFANPDGDFPEGFDEWIVLKPWVAAASNCIVPANLMAANLDGGKGSHFTDIYCPIGNVAGGQTATQFTVPYFDESGVLRGGTNLPDDHPESRHYNPLTDAPNGGQGFFKDLSGNELPNAPRFTFAAGAQYTFYLPSQLELTPRVDFYWQDKSFARIYNSEYDRLRDWTNTNVSLWVEKRDWDLKVEAYVKNVFDETPITGTFLNSDDSGLTTNVFTLDPRLVGLSITKRF